MRPRHGRLGSQERLLVRARGCKQDCPSIRGVTDLVDTPSLLGRKDQQTSVASRTPGGPFSATREGNTSSRSVPARSHSSAALNDTSRPRTYGQSAFTLRAQPIQEQDSPMPPAGLAPGWVSGLATKVVGRQVSRVSRRVVTEGIAGQGWESRCALRPKATVRGPKPDTAHSDHAAPTHRGPVRVIASRTAGTNSPSRCRSPPDR
jgi:hypothetical protein